MLKIKINNVKIDDVEKEINDLISSKLKVDQSSSKKIRPSTERFVPRRKINLESKSIDNILKLDGKNFIVEAYRYVLGREPDEEGLNYYLSKLMSGDYSKLDVIVRLRYSSEGRRRGIKIKGLWPKAIFSFVKHRPIIGKLVASLKTLIKLYEVNKFINYFENSYKPLILEINHKLIEFEARMEELKSNVNELLKLNHNVEDLMKFKFRVNHYIKEFDEFKGTLLNVNHKVFEIEQELEKVEIPQVLMESVKFPVNRNLPYYFAFEEVFRGYEELIRERQKIYLDFISVINDYPVLDVGFGRGEFLELLKEKEIPYIGIDIDEYFVKLAKEKDLNVKKADVVDFLSKTQTSFSAITSFHVIEHLELPRQKKFIELAFSKLTEGGKLIIETPNPWYLHAFGNFYLDETHLKPIPPETLAFLFKWIGFKNVQIIYLNPIKTSIPAKDDPKIYYQDYAIVGEK